VRSRPRGTQKDTEARGECSLERGIACRRRHERDGPTVRGRQQSGEFQRPAGPWRAVDGHDDGVRHLDSQRAPASDQDWDRSLFYSRERGGTAAEDKQVVAITAVA
jgi:hypothetical protein